MAGWEQLHEGSAPQAREYGPITRTDMVRYQGASGDFNPIHHDTAFATGRKTLSAALQTNIRAHLSSVERDACPQ